MVRTYGSGGKTELTRGLPGVRFSASATAESFGSNDAQALAQLGAVGMNLGRQLTGYVSALEGIMEKERDRADRALARDRINQYRTASQELMNEVLQTKGEEAVASYETYKVPMQELRKKFADGLNPQALDYYDISTMDYEASHLVDMINFQRKAAIAFDQTTKEAAINTSIIEAVQNRAIPSKIDQELEEVEANVRSLHKGEAKEVIDAKVTLTKHTLLAEVTEALAEEDPEAALKHMALYEEDIDPRYYAGMTEKLRKQMLTKKAIERVKSWEAQGLSFGEQVEELDNLKDADAYEETMRILNNRANERSKVAVVDQHAAVKSAVDDLMKDPQNFNPYSVKGLTVEKMKDLSELRQLMLGPSDYTDWGVYSKIKQMAPSDFTELDLTSPELIKRLAKPELKELINEQSAIIQGTQSGRSRSSLMGFGADVDKQLNVIISKMKDFTPGYGASDEERFEAARRTSELMGVVYERINARDVVSEGKWTVSEINKIIWEELSTYTYDPGVFSSEQKKYNFELKSEPYRLRFLKNSKPEKLPESAVFQPGVPTNSTEAKAGAQPDRWLVRTGPEVHVYDIHGNYIKTFVPGPDAEEWDLIKTEEERAAEEREQKAFERELKKHRRSPLEDVILGPKGLIGVRTPRIRTRDYDPAYDPS